MAAFCFRLFVATACAAAVTLGAAPTLAGSFADDGTFVFDPQAVATFDFEEPVASGADAAELLAPTADDAALSGGSVLRLSPYQGAEVEVAIPKLPRTYRSSFWIRGGETVGGLEISYSDSKRTDDVAGLYPTGRMTSDGWVELANDRLRIDGARATRVVVAVFSPAGADVDAVELTVDGEIAEGDVLPGAPCDGATDPSACGVGQVCLWSACRDASAWVPPIPPDRDDVADYLGARAELLFGPFIERTLDLPAAQVAFDQMRFAQDRWSYWNGFLLGVRRLHDGHTTTSSLADFVLENPKPLSVCFLEGDGDLSHSVAPKDPSYLDVLVSHTGADHHLGLAPGDRLVRVDGQHPIAWARSLIAIQAGQPAISNHQTFAELASALRAMIPRYASHIEVVRCAAQGGEPPACGPVETLSIAGLPADPPGTPFDYVACDNRPLRHLPDAPKNHASASWDTVYSGIVVESDDEERIYGLEWESLYTSNGSDGVGKALKDAVGAWKKKEGGARGVILDHRLGHGGTRMAPEILWAFAVPTRPNDYYEDRRRAEDEQPTLAEGLAIFEDAKSKGWAGFAGSVNALVDVPVALLVTEDVSASDWLPLGLKGAPKVRIFGPYQTNGAFSTRYAFGYWLSMSYVIAVGDTYLPDGSTANGRGVEPDEVVLPKQSDLILGKDTVYEAALAWVRKELKP